MPLQQRILAPHRAPLWRGPVRSPSPRNCAALPAGWPRGRCAARWAARCWGGASTVSGPRGRRAASPLMPLIIPDSGYRRVGRALPRQAAPGASVTLPPAGTPAAGRGHSGFRPPGLSAGRAASRGGGRPADRLPAAGSPRLTCTFTLLPSLEKAWHQPMLMRIVGSGLPRSELPAGAAQFEGSREPIPQFCRLDRHRASAVRAVQPVPGPGRPPRQFRNELFGLPRQGQFRAPSSRS